MPESLLNVLRRIRARIASGRSRPDTSAVTTEGRLPVLIYGAGQTGQQLAAALLRDDRLRPVAFADDEPRLRGIIVSGLRVHGPEEIVALVVRHGIGRIILAMPRGYWINR